MADTMNDESSDLRLIARTIAVHDVTIATHEELLQALFRELVEMRRAVDQTTIRLRCLERRGQQREER
jgi:hypothetical protein